MEPNPLESRDNSIGFLRLVLASMVIFDHAYELGGAPASNALRWAIEPICELAVPGFFVLSGLLITRSFIASKSIRNYFKKRALRILPGYYACLLVMVLIFGPLIAVAESGSLSGYFNLAKDGPLFYLVNNVALLQRQASFNELLSTVPYPNAMNGSLWTLFNEAVCYIMIALIGIVGVYRRAPWLMIVFALGLLGILNLPADVISQLPERIQRTGFKFMLIEHFLWFALGSLAWLFRDRIVLNRWLALLALVLTATALYTGSRHILLPIPFAYLLIWLAYAMPYFKNIDAKRDLSYGVYVYAFPVQQTLALFGVHQWGYVPYVVSTFIFVIPLAWLSWTYVERPFIMKKSPAKVH